MLPITSADDPRLDAYRDLTKRRLDDPSGTFIAESEPVVRRLLASGLAVDSILLTEHRLQSLMAAPAPEAPRPDIPIYVVAQDIMDGVAGFHVHRGCLAVGRRPHAPRIPDGARLVIVLEDLMDVDNVGSIVRNACAFGADALLLSPRAADPYYRKAIRVAMGNTFSLPIVRAKAWPDDLAALATRGFTLIGTVLGKDATPLADFRPTGPLAIAFGSEGPGLSQAAINTCQTLLTIPMRSADSLNVATACAVFLYQLTLGSTDARGPAERESAFPDRR